MPGTREELGSVLDDLLGSSAPSAGGELGSVLDDLLGTDPAAATPVSGAARGVDELRSAAGYEYSAGEFDRLSGGRTSMPAASFDPGTDPAAVAARQDIADMKSRAAAAQPVGPFRTDWERDTATEALRLSMDPTRAIVPMGMQAGSELSPGQALVEGARTGWTRSAPAVLGGDRGAVGLPEPSGVSGFLGETAAGLVGGTLNPAEAPANVLGFLTGAKAVQMAGPTIQRVARAAGPRVAAILEHEIGGAAGSAPIGMLQTLESIPEEQWLSDPVGSLWTVVKGTGGAAIIGGAAGTVSGAIAGRPTLPGPKDVPTLIGESAGVDGRAAAEAATPTYRADVTLDGQRAAMQYQEAVRRGTGQGIDTRANGGVDGELARRDAVSEPVVRNAERDPQAAGVRPRTDAPAETTADVPGRAGDIPPVVREVPTLDDLKALPIEELRAKAAELELKPRAQGKDKLAERVHQAMTERADHGLDRRGSDGVSGVELAGRGGRAADPGANQGAPRGNGDNTRALELAAKTPEELRALASELGVKPRGQSRTKFIDRIVEAEAAAGRKPAQNITENIPGEVAAAVKPSERLTKPGEKTASVDSLPDSTKPPTVSDRLIAVADEWDRRAQKLTQGNQIPRSNRTGQRAGASVSFTREAAALAIRIAARAVRTGAKGAKALRAVADEFGGEIPNKRLLEHASRIAGRLVKGATDKAGNIDPDAFDFALSEFSRRETAKPRRSTKRDVNRAAGVSSDQPPTITQRQALVGKLKAEAKGSREGYREGQTVAKARADARMDKYIERAQKRGDKTERQALKSKFRYAQRAANAAYREGRRVGMEAMRPQIDRLKQRIAEGKNAAHIQAEAFRLARENLPLRARGKVLAAIRQATTLDKLSRAIGRMEREANAYLGRSDVRKAGKVFSRAMKKPDVDLMRQMHEVITGKKVSANLKVKRADLRATAKKWASDIRERLGSGDPDTVAQARAEATDVLNELKGHLHEFRRQNRVILEGKLVEAQELRSELAADVRKARPPVKRPAKLVADASQKMEDTLHRGYLRKQLTDDTMLQMLGDGRDHVAVRVGVDALWNGESRWHGRIRDFQTDLDSVVRRGGWGSIGEAMAQTAGVRGRASQHTIDVDLGAIKRVSLGQAMEILAVDKTTGGRITRGNQIVFRTRGNNPVNVTPEAIATLREKVGAKRLALIDDVAALITEHFQGDLFAALKAIKGWQPEHTDWYHPTRRKMELSHDPDKYNGWAGAMNSHLEDAGFTKNREGGKTPYVIGDYFDTILHHAQMSSAIIELAEPIRTAEMVLLHPDMRPVIAEKFGDPMIARIEQRLRAASELGKYEVGAEVDRWFLRLVQNTSRALTSLSKNAWLRQLGGVASIAAEMHPRSYAAGVETVANPVTSRAVYKEMVKNSGFFWNRWAVAPSALMSGLGETHTATFSGSSAKAATAAAGRSLGAAGRSLVERDVAGVKEHVVDTARQASRVFDAIRVSMYADSQAARVAWAGFKAEVERLHPDWSADRKMQYVREHAESTVRRTQNTFSVLDSSELTQDARKSAVKAAFVAFTGDSNKSLNQIAQATRTRDVKRLAGVSALRALNALWGAVVTAGTPLALYQVTSSITGNAAGKEQAEDRAKAAFADQLTREIFGTVFFGDRVYDLLAGAAKGVSDDAFESATGSYFSQAVTGIARIATGVYERATTAAEEDPAKAEKAVAKYMRGLEDVTLGVSVLGGVPLAPWYRDAKRVHQAANATHMDLIIHQRRKLKRVPEKERTHEQVVRLAELDRFMSRIYGDYRERANKLKKTGRGPEAEKVEAALEERARAFMGPRSADDRTALQR